MLLPNVERDGNHRVEDDDVGPEGEEGGETGIGAVLPRQEDGELGALVLLPEQVSYRQDGAHEGQEAENLQGENGD